MRLNKVNLCWVLSEGRKGHEIQSMTLAERLAKQVNLHFITIKQPWDAFTPRIMPGFNLGLTYKGQHPKFSQAPDIIITTGRKAAAAGKFITQLLRKQGKKLKHIQILNPKDKASHYDVLLIPEHDQVNGPNVITFTGSLHPYSPQWFENSKIISNDQNLSIAVLLGNPPTQYFKYSFQHDLYNIRKIYPEQTLMICGSPRLSCEVIDDIKALIEPNDNFWFNQEDGPNPYQQILLQAKHIFVTADSINMMNESAGSSATITLLALKHINSQKHKTFITNLSHRWADFSVNKTDDVNPVPYGLIEVLNNHTFEKLINN